MKNLLLRVKQKFLQQLGCEKQSWQCDIVRKKVNLLGIKIATTFPGNSSDKTKTQTFKK